MSRSVGTDGTKLTDNQTWIIGSLQQTTMKLEEEYLTSLNHSEIERTVEQKQLAKLFVEVIAKFYKIIGENPGFHHRLVDSISKSVLF